MEEEWTDGLMEKRRRRRGKGLRGKN